MKKAKKYFIIITSIIAIYLIIWGIYYSYVFSFIDKYDMKLEPITKQFYVTEYKVQDESFYIWIYNLPRFPSVKWETSVNDKYNNQIRIYKNLFKKEYELILKEEYIEENDIYTQVREYGYVLDSDFNVIEYHNYDMSQEAFISKLNESQDTFNTLKDQAIKIFGDDFFK